MYKGKWKIKSRHKNKQWESESSLLLGHSAGPSVLVSKFQAGWCPGEIYFCNQHSSLWLGFLLCLFGISCLPIMPINYQDWNLSCRLTVLLKTYRAQNHPGGFDNIQIAGPHHQGFWLGRNLNGAQKFAFLKFSVHTDNPRLETRLGRYWFK